jgi:hypothetical protein
MYIKLLILLLVALSFASCTPNHRTVEIEEDTPQPVVIEPTVNSPQPETVEPEDGVPELGLVVDEGLRVIAIEANSAAEKAGVQVGDSLLDLGLVTPEGIPALPLKANGVFTATNNVVIAPGGAPPMTAGTMMTQATVVRSGEIVTGSMAFPPVSTHIVTEGGAAGNAVVFETNDSSVAAGGVMTQGVFIATVPFTEKELIKSLVEHGQPLKLRVIRAGQVMELMITPTPSASEPDANIAPIPTQEFF